MAQQLHLPVRKQKTLPHTSHLACQLLIPALAVIAGWKPSPDVHTKWMHHKGCGTENEGGAAVIQGTVIYYCQTGVLQWALVLHSY